MGDTLGGEQKGYWGSMDLTVARKKMIFIIHYRGFGRILPIPQFRDLDIEDLKKEIAKYLNIHALSKLYIKNVNNELCKITTTDEMKQALIELQKYSVTKIHLYVDAPRSSFSTDN